VEDDRVALSSIRRGPGSPGRRSALAIRSPRRRRRLHLVRHVRRHSPSRGARRGSLARVLEASPDLDRGGSAWKISLLLRALPSPRVFSPREPLRALRSPIKFYLRTTACVALLSGFAAERLRPGPARAGRRAAAAVFAVAAAYGACLLLCRPGGPFDAIISP